MNQLLRENNQAANKTWVWTYDNAGNIQSKAEYAYTTGELGEAVDTVSYGYDNDDWGDLLTSYDGVDITYDEIGNPVDDGTWEYAWQHGREMERMSDGTTAWTFIYDANGMRTSRTDGTTTYNYVYNGGSLVQMTVGSNALYFTSDTVTFNGVTYYYVKNLQGDVTAIVDGSGATVATYVYDAWGNLISDEPAENTVGHLNPIRYRGYIYDTESGYYYLQSRYYDPELGRFLNADAFASTGQGIIGNNMFAYCLNNPICLCDATGYACSVYYDGSGRFDLINGIADSGVNGASSYQGGYAGGVWKRKPNLPELANPYNPFNDNEYAVLNARRFAFYKGTIVIKCGVLDDTAVSFGIILMGPNVTSPELVKHERGHVDQLTELGVYNYFTFVMVPSVSCYWLTEYDLLPDSIYHSLPWEYKANEYGQATFSFTVWAKTASNIYWECVRMMSMVS